jgi:molybdopterin synthase catalytic subunit
VAEEVNVQIEVRGTSFDSWQELSAYRKAYRESGQHGACATFVGTMRGENEGDQVLEMYLEHYPGMTEKQLEEIVDESLRAHELMDVLLLHRMGTVQPGEDIVLVAVWSAHRKEAFAACREIMEALKSKAPFWKKETLRDGDRWVEQNTLG